MEVDRRPDRRALSRRGVICAAGVGLISASRALAAPHASEASVSPEVAMARLAAGNARFVAHREQHPHLDGPLRKTIAASQHPFATILACADSRVAPELIFDQGLGDLFVVRVAGNVVDDAILASIEYSVIHTGSALVMVLGHERCGAVTATAEALSGHGSEDDKGTHIGALADLIGPAVKAVPASAPDRLDAAISLNAASAAAAISAESPPLKARIVAGHLKIVAARYDLDDGRVTYIRT